MKKSLLTTGFDQKIVIEPYKESQNSIRKKKKVN